MGVPRALFGSWSMPLEASSSLVMASSAACRPCRQGREIQGRWQSGL